VHASGDLLSTGQTTIASRTVGFVAADVQEDDELVARHALQVWAAGVAIAVAATGNEAS
jgi:hypothetical protein